MFENVSTLDTNIRNRGMYSVMTTKASIASIFMVLLSFAPSTAQEAEHGNAVLVRTFFDQVLNAGDVTILSETMTETYIQHNPFVPSGRDGFVNALADFRGAFPNYRSEIDQMAVDGDRVWVMHTAVGTHCASYFGIEAEGRSFEIQVVDIFRIEDGRLAEHWDVFPAERLIAQLTDESREADMSECEVVQ